MWGVHASGNGSVVTLGSEEEQTTLHHFMKKIVAVFLLKMESLAINEVLLFFNGNE